MIDGVHHMKDLHYIIYVLYKQKYTNKVIPRNYVYICYSESYCKCIYKFWVSLYLMLLENINLFVLKGAEANLYTFRE